MKITLLIGVLAALGTATAAQAQNTVVPGKSAGHVHLGDSLGKVARSLGGTAPINDAAMGGKNWATWIPGVKASDEPSLPPLTIRQVNVYFQRDLVRGEPSGEQRARIVQVNSPFFRTVPGRVTPGKSTLADIHRAFPHAVPTGSGYTLSNGAPVDFYADKSRGIGFLVTRATPRSRGRCLLLTVFTPGESYGPYFKQAVSP